MSDVPDIWFRLLVGTWAAFYLKCYNRTSSKTYFSQLGTKEFEAQPCRIYENDANTGFAVFGGSKKGWVDLYPHRPEIFSLIQVVLSFVQVLRMSSQATLIGKACASIDLQDFL